MPANVGIENTMAAFENAVALGYRYVETDVHATADGVVVAFHDESLDRVAGRGGLIRDLSWDQVSEVKLPGGQGIPRLIELFDAFPDLRINLDIKADGATEPLWDVITDYSAQERVCVGSFSETRIRRFRALSGGSVATAASPRETALLRLGPRPIVGRLKPAYDVLQVPHRHTVKGRTITVVTQGFVRRAHRIGVDVHVWTIDDPAEMTELLDLGVDGLVSDRIELLKDVLVARAEWR